MAFDLAGIVHTEFGVARRDGEHPCYQVPVTPEVTQALGEMLATTMQKLGPIDELAALDLSEKYGTEEHLKYSTHEDTVEQFASLLTAQNIPIAGDALENPRQVDYYFATFTDGAGKKCVAVRKAAQFKAGLGKRFIHFLDGTLTLVTDNLFKLDPDFDFVVFEDQIAILRPTSFETLGNFDAALLEAAPVNVATIAATMQTVNFAFAEALIPKSKRACRLLAALRSRGDLGSISLDELKGACTETGIDFTEEDGKLQPTEDDAYTFLLLLDRRMYADPLLANAPDVYEASARRKVIAQ